jgi:Na+-transporting methylmalonyl-CoA/oxaloacetate decarboxylase gamma subunit
MGRTVDSTAWRIPLKLAGVLPVLIFLLILLAVMARVGQRDGDIDLRDEREERTPRHPPVGRRHR